MRCLLPIVTVLSLAGAGSVRAQYQPAIERDSFLRLHFYEQSGGFLFEELQIVFPPDGQEEIQFVIQNDQRETVASLPLFLELWPGFPVFGRLRPNGVPGVVSVGAPGRYVMSVRIGGEPISELAFAIGSETSGDPFNPSTTYTIEGSWPSLAYFSRPVDRPDDALMFHYWASNRERSGDERFPRLAARLMFGEETVAVSPSPVTLPSGAWRAIEHTLVKPGEAREPFTLANLTETDGDYQLVIDASGEPFKTYSVAVVDGAIRQLDRCQLDYEPHTAFVSPRRIAPTAPGRETVHMVDAFWVESVSR